jgi:hypothetical protein
MVQVSILIHLKMFFRIFKLQLKIEFLEKWHLFHNSFNTRGGDSSVSIATRYVLDGPGIDS